jgi:pimeloyl-ACP methyl ester carboxylesterase
LQARLHTRWRERLPEIEVPTLVVHGRRNRFFPVGNAEAIAREVPGARLLVLEEAAAAVPDAAIGEVAEAMLTLGQGFGGPTASPPGQRLRSKADQPAPRPAR